MGPNEGKIVGVQTRLTVDRFKTSIDADENTMLSSYELSLCFSLSHTHNHADTD